MDRSWIVLVLCCSATIITALDNDPAKTYERYMMKIAKTILKGWTLGCLGVFGVLIISFLVWSIGVGVIQPLTAAGTTCLRESACVYTLTDGPNGVRIIDYTPDGSRLISRGNNILIRDAATGDRVRRLNPSVEGHYTLQFMGDWPEIAVLGRGMIEFYDYDGVLKRTWRGAPGERTTHFAALPNANGFALAQEDAILFYSLSDGRPFSQLPDSAGMSQLSASHDGEIMAAYHTETGVIHIWPLSNLQAAVAIPTADPVRDLQVSADGSLVIWRSEGDAFVAQTADGAMRFTVPGMGAVGVTTLSLAANGERLAVGFADGSVEIWSIESGAIEGLLEHNRELSGLVLSPDGQHLAVSLRRNVVVTMPDEYERQQRINNPNQPVSRTQYPMVSSRRPGFAIVWALGGENP